MKLRCIFPIVELTAVSAIGRAAVSVEEPRCDQGVHPLGVDVAGPEISWKIVLDQRCAHVAAWQILVATSEQLLAYNRGELRDSGRVSAERVNRIAYAGKPLASSGRCHWKVRVFDRDGGRSEDVRRFAEMDRRVSEAFNKQDLDSGLHWVECAYDSVHGRIASRWRKCGQQCELTITIPANSTGSILIPSTDAHRVIEGGQPVAQAEGVKLLRRKNGGAFVAMESGSYRFQSKLNAESSAR